MATKIAMPKLGLTMVEGRIAEWNKREGDAVEKGDVLLVIETEKVSYEIESPESGILTKVAFQEGDVIPAGGLLAYIIQPGEKLGEALNDVALENKEKAIGKNVSKGKIATNIRTSVSESAGYKKIKSSPLARKIARENNIDISIITGTGPGGRIVKKDVIKAIDQKTIVDISETEVLPCEEEIIPLTSMRKTIARRMSHSFQTAPHFWLQNEIDATELIKSREILLPIIEKETGDKVSYTDILIKIVAKAIEDFPYVNASWSDEGIKLFKTLNIGLAIDVPNGLIVPVMRDVENKSLAEIVADRVDLVSRAKNNKLTLDEMSGGTFTFNNVGGLGITVVNSIINPPESCILGIGAIVDRPVVLNGEIVVRPIFYLSLGCDHRIMDGGYGARFLIRLKNLIEKPILMIS